MSFESQTEIDKRTRADAFMLRDRTPSPMNEAKACSGDNYPSLPPYPGVYSDGKGHSLRVSYETRQPTITALPTAPLSQCAFLHADNDPDFQCSFRPAAGSQYCSFHRTAVAGEIVHAKAEAYDKLTASLLRGESDSSILSRTEVEWLLRLVLRNQPDTKKLD